MGTPPISSAMSRNLISSGALWVSPFSSMLLRNIEETQKKQSFLRKGIRGMKRQSPLISY